MVARTVFVGGVHGVGKTSFCRSIVEQFDVEHVTASSLIGRHVKHSKNKTVLDIKNNQSILTEELSRYQADYRTILLDGHFCLLKDTSDVLDVPLEIFKAISPHAIFLLTDDPDSIAERLSNRDKYAYGLELIAELQTREVERANFVSQSLDVPIVVIKPMVDIEQSIIEIATYL